MISVSSRKILQFLTLFVLGITSANLVVQVSKFFLGHDYLFGLSRLLDINNENSIPAWYSSMTLLLCAFLLWIIGSVQSTPRDAKYWKGLGAIFLVLSLDEAASIHELLIPIGNLFNASGLLMFIWVIPGIAFVAGVALVYWKFLLSLPKTTQYGIIAAGIVYVMGTVGMEMLGGLYIQYTTDHGIDILSGWGGMSFALVLALEEFLEMLGILIFIYALLSYLNVNVKKVQVKLSESATDRAHPTAEYDGPAFGESR